MDLKKFFVFFVLVTFLFSSVPSFAFLGFDFDRFISFHSNDYNSYELYLISSDSEKARFSIKQLYDNKIEKLYLKVGKSEERFGLLFFLKESTPKYAVLLVNDHSYTILANQKLRIVEEKKRKEYQITNPISDDELRNARNLVGQATTAGSDGETNSGFFSSFVSWFKGFFS